MGVVSKSKPQDWLQLEKSTPTFENRDWSNPESKSEASE